MKQNIFSALLIVPLAVSACSKSSDNTSTSNIAQSAGQVVSVVGSTWRVTLFTDSGNDETADFAGYSFSFNTGNQLAKIMFQYSNF